MLLQYMKNHVADRLDHIEKHLTEARRQLAVVSSDEALIIRMKACLSLGTEIDVIKGDTESILAVIGAKGDNEDAMKDMTPVIEELNKMRELRGDTVDKCPGGGGFGKHPDHMNACATCPVYDACVEACDGD